MFTLLFIILLQLKLDMYKILIIKIRKLEGYTPLAPLRRMPLLLGMHFYFLMA